MRSVNLPFSPSIRSLSLDKLKLSFIKSNYFLCPYVFLFFSLPLCLSLSLFHNSISIFLDNHTLYQSISICLYIGLALSLLFSKRRFESKEEKSSENEGGKFFFSFLKHIYYILRSKKCLSLAHSTYLLLVIYLFISLSLY